MGHGNLSMKKRSRQFHLLDLASAAIFLAVACSLPSGTPSLLLAGALSPNRARMLDSGRGLSSWCPPGSRCRPARLTSSTVCPARTHVGSATAPLRRIRCSALSRHHAATGSPSPGQTACLSASISIPFARLDLSERFLVKFQVWRSNMPHFKIAGAKVYQELVKEDCPSFVFPDEGTLFPGGAMQYIEKLAQYIPISKHELRTALDMGCGLGNNRS
ncbi:putative methyltransferase [Nymphaea thermarum]|nr:putative methyltransferase [Nymphaea thermarum]